MEPELRPVIDDELPAYIREAQRAFGGVLIEDVEMWRSVTELSRTIGAFDDGEVVGTAGAFTFELTVPGGSVVPAAGVTLVSVRSTHRRRGLLRAMMDAQLDDVVARGEPVAVLTASESAIYGRFGYGQASAYHAWTLATEGTALAQPPEPGGRFRMVEADEASKILPAVHDRARLRHPGQVSVPERWWRADVMDRAEERKGASPLFFVVHEGDGGEPDGIAAYRVKGKWANGLPDGEVIVGGDCYALDDEVEAALLAFLLSIDLTRSVRAEVRPVDDPFRWRLADPRRCHVDHIGDHLWVRILDVAGAMGARTYGAEGRLVLDLVDPFRPANDGRWLVEGGADGGAARRTVADADLALDVSALGSLYLGGVPATVLARAGRIEECRPGALRRADALFAAERAPWCSVEF